MNEREHDALLETLASLNDNVPPMPEDFHAGWTKLVEDEAMENNTTPTRKPRISAKTRTTITRFLSVAAALVFVVGGTLLTRDELPTGRSAKSGSYRAAETTSYDGGYGTAYSNANSPKMMNLMSEAAYDADAVYDAAEETAEYEESGAVRESKIIRTAGLSITSPDYEGSAQALRNLCEQYGGWIASSSESVNYNKLHTAYFTFRIPSDQLDAFLEGTGTTGRVTSRNESATDVTESYYDTAARLATQQALMARLLSLVTDAADLNDLLTLEEKIANVQYTIDRLQSSLNSTDRQVNYSTVDVTLREEAPQDIVENPQLSLGERLLSGLSIGWESFSFLLSDMLVFLVSALPYLAAIAAVIVVLKVIFKKRRK